MTKKGSYTTNDIFEITVCIFNVLGLGVVFGYTVSKIGSIFSELS